MRKTAHELPSQVLPKVTIPMTYANKRARKNLHPSTRFGHPSYKKHLSHVRRAVRVHESSKATQGAAPCPPMSAACQHAGSHVARLVTLRESLIRRCLPLPTGWNRPRGLRGGGGPPMRVKRLLYVAVAFTWLQHRRIMPSRHDHPRTLVLDSIPGSAQDWEDTRNRKVSNVRIRGKYRRICQPVE